MNVSLDDINIRTEYKPGDIGYITYMHGVFYEFGPPFESYVAETLGAFYKNLDSSRERFWIAEYADKIIGTIALKNTSGEAQLRYFLINPDFRGIGLGKALMDLFMDFLIESGYKSSFLLTEERLKTAAALYERYGYYYASSRPTDFGLVEMRYEMKVGSTDHHDQS